ncbi:calponin homology domain-containing protein [Obelidium mucronatum]|nr:calponin homology domain-containing protein [Obelidium mucronatum]
MGESRTELLAWLNDLCQVNYTKIEQCGTGAVHCAIIDSIYKDVPLSKVKFNAKQEYEYVTNFKILQAAFDKHKIDNAIPVERLMKCKFQDNIEFLQWLKKYWDQYFPGGPYDAAGRRGGAHAAGGAVKSVGTPIKKAAASSATNRSAIAPAAFGAAKSAPLAAPAAEYQKKLAEVTQHAEELKETVGQVEKERDFYFAKLREIEMFVSGQLEEGGSGNKESLTYIQNIMYKTEDGFEPPAATEETF